MKYQRVFFETLDERGPAALLAEMSSNIFKVTDLFGPELPNCISGMSAFVISISVAISRSWQLGLIMLGTLPVLMLFMALAMGSFQKMVKYATSICGAGARLFEQGLWGIRTVAAYGLEERIAEHCEPWHVMFQKLCTRLAWFGSLWFANRAALEWLAAALTYYLGSRFVIAGEENPMTGKTWTPGNIFSVWFIVYLGMSQLQLCTTYAQSFSEGRGALQILKEHQESGNDDIEGPKMRALADAEADSAKADALEDISLVEFDGVSFRYPSRPDVLVLDNVSFTIKKGQRVALVGESGSGKSTIIGLLERFYEPCGGQILVNGVDIRKYPLQVLRGAMALVEQEPVLFTTSLRANLEYASPVGSKPSEKEIEEMGKKCSFTAVDSLPDRYDTFAGPKGRAFSGGERQRVCIARALLRRPKLLLLDEATSALDNETEREIQRTLDDVITEAGMSLTIAHRLRTVKDSDVVIVFKQGTIVERGSHDELMAKGSAGMYYGLVKLQEVAEQGGEDGAVSSADGVPGAVDDVHAPDPLSKTKTTKLTAPGEQKDPLAKAKAAKRAAPDSPTDAAKTEGLPDASKITPRRVVPVTRSLFALVWKYSPCDCILLLAQVLGFVGLAATQAPFALVLIGIMTSLYQPNLDEVDRDTKLGTVYLVLLGAAQWTAAQLRIGVGIHGSNGFFAKARAKIVKNVIFQDPAFFDNPECSPAKIITTYTASLPKGLELVTRLTPTIIQAISCITITLALALSVQTEVGAVVLAVWPVNLVGKYLEFKDLLKKFQRGGGTSAETASAEVFHDSISFLKTVRAMQCEQQKVREFEELTAQEGFKNYLSMLRTGLIKAAANALEFGVFAFAFWYSTRAIARGAPFQDCMSAQMVIILGLMPIANFLSAFDNLPLQVESGARVLDLINARPSIHTGAPAPKEPYRVAGTKIKFDAVEFRYMQRPDVQVLKSVSFEVKLGAGVTVGLCGPSGSGKSSILSLLMRFYDPTGGSISVEGLGELRGLDVRRWRRTIGYVSQEPTLFQDTLLNNVRYGSPEASPEDLQRVAMAAHLDFVSGDESFTAGSDLDVPDCLLPGERKDILQQGKTKELTAEALLGRRGSAASVASMSSQDARVAWTDPVRDSTLSGGQRQRVAVARSLLRNPPILVLDEATSALDSFSEKVILDSLSACRDGKTQFVVAHRLSAIADSDLILVVSMGVVVESGTSEELLSKRGLYYSLVQGQAIPESPRGKAPEPLARMSAGRRKVSRPAQTARLAMNL
eukprot:CAMPEP_0179025480 /NCGR_PEP_ID=MMETSP0796-20121207/8008_1 /TAXON_ID=73915 /ORGANISM="Pyrodinium bahamense, Strain pbaha01" /LENGTH=1260 /DNA_ID=CAMNT_0020721505 /DNA_START=45 /DNA_END=3825 /DNA_ORIENTATION=-